ncbi:MAG: NAD(P)H-binding protein [Chitinophagaceae bacterium]|nr:NAD(P)H-binding protein [Chitinophagaceae bacterium]
MNEQTAVVLGATGLIGNYVVQQLIKDPTFTTVRLLVRKPIPQPHEKVQVVVSNFSNPTQFKMDLGKGDCIFCCVGTTLKKVGGDKEHYRTVDYDIAVHAARFGKEAGFKKYLLVSSVGARASSKNFYSRLKGEIEGAIQNIGLSSTHIFRPSFLMGDRKEFRPGELAAKAVMKIASFLMVSDLRKYRGIDAIKVAKAMVQAAKPTTEGTFVYEYAEIMKLAHTH